jgi:predicted TIM-barrel fold metal-dependent hydrolase
MKLWANSGDSHLLEPEDLFTAALPARLAHRAPRSERNDRYEDVIVDGQLIRRSLAAFGESTRPPGASDLAARILDLDAEGVWAQLAFPSTGLWLTTIEDRELAQATTRAYNDWAAEEVIAREPRILPAAIVSTVSVDDAVQELGRATLMGFQTIFLPTMVRDGLEYADERYEPLWAAAEEAGVLLAFHIGTGANPVAYRGRGGAVINYWETTVPGQRVITHLVGAGVLDRYPHLNVMIAEGGASWVPALADRLDEAYRQHGFYVKPKLSMLPSEQIFRQVYTSFQHDVSAVPAATSMGYRNIMWGDDYPHLEGTYGHTQETLHSVFDGAPADVVEHLTVGCFESLFRAPARAHHVSEPVG